MQLVQNQRDFYYYENYAEVMGVPPDHSMSGVHAYVAIALRMDEELVGIISVDNLLTDAPITLEDIDALVPFANQTALAIRNARLLEEQESLLARQRSLTAISEAVYVAQDAVTILEMVWDAVTGWGGFESVSIWRREDARDVFAEVWGTDVSGRRMYSTGNTFPVDSFLEEVFPQFGEANQNVAWASKQGDLAALPMDHPFYEGRHRVAIAIWGDKKLMGVLALGHHDREKPPSPKRVEALGVLVQQVSVALHHWALREEQRYRLAKEEHLLQIAKAINDQKPLEEVLALIYDAIHQVEKIDRIGINYIDSVHQTILGSWGTDRTGKRYLMSTKREAMHDNAWQNFIDTPDQEYKHYENFTLERSVAPQHHMYGVKEHAVLTLRANEELLGFLCVDNVLSGNPLSRQKVVELFTFANQAAIAIRDSNLRRSHELSVMHQQYLNDILRSANRGDTLSSVLLKVYEGVMRCGGFDRVGIFVLDNRRNLLRGAWGTGNDGSCVDMSSILFRVDSAYRVAMGVDEEHPYMILEDYTKKYAPPPGNVMYGVHYHASMLLRIEGETVGIISMDNLFQDYPITPADMEVVLPFAEQTAVIVRNTLLQEERNRHKEWQLSLEELASSIHSNTSLNDILYQVRSAALEIGGFDRAGVFIIDEETSQVQGTWGTDRTGNLAELFDDVMPYSEDEGLNRLRNEGLPYILVEDYTALYKPGSEDSMHGVRHFAQVAISTEDTVLGYLCVDNLLSDRPIAEADIKTLIPFLQQAALVIRNIRLREESQRTRERQVYLEKIGESIRANTDLNAILQQVRDVVVQIGFFDRAGVFLYDAKQEQLHGTWGTDREGQLEDLSSQVFTRDTAQSLSLWKPIEKRERYQIIENFTEELSLEEGHFMYGVTYHACLPMIVGEEVVGLLAVDTLLTQRRTTPEHMEILLPFVGQTALAIRNARMLEERKHYLERQRLLSHLAAAISVNTDLSELLRLAREAIVKGAGFDRAGIYLVDPKRDRLLGTWGTDREGNEEEISHLILDSIDCTIVSTNTCTPLGRYELIENYTQSAGLAKTDPMYGVQAHGTVFLEIQSEFVGILFVDNFVTQKPITHEDMIGLLSFTSQIVVAIRNASMFAERERYLERQRRLSHLAVAISVHTNLNELLRLARKAVVKGAGFDRAAIYLTDEMQEQMQGTWGTDRLGQEESLTHETFVIDQSFYETTVTPHGRYNLIADYTSHFQLEETHPLYGVRSHGSVLLESEGEFVGILFVDNLLSGRAITNEDMLGLLPFAGQIVVAIRNARLIQRLTQAHEALISTERLRAVGELASGVAHNVNNILAAVLGYAELIQEAPNLPEGVLQYAQTIEKAAMDGANIVRRIQHFARKDSKEAQSTFDLGEVVQEAIVLTRPLWDRQVPPQRNVLEVISDIQTGISVFGVASELREVVVNLIRNAMDAMPSGGFLTVHCQIQDRTACLKVLDTGVGMQESVQRRLFEPFFTTKIGLGTGLGLAIAWGIVERHHGKIEVESEIGKGSSFTIWLPLAHYSQVRVFCDLSSSLGG